jgi:hypothetical protein
MPVAGLALILGLAPVRPAHAGSSGDGPPVVTNLQVPLQGVVQNAGCPAIAVDGTVHLLVLSQVDPSTGTVVAQVLLNGAVFGETANEQPYVGALTPLQAAVSCTPPDPCAPLSFETRYFAIGPPAFEPPDPCDQREVTGTLSLTFNTDGTLGRWYLNPQPLPPG